ncbi:MAG: hypothetical protein JXA11_11760 [Phycisphaerae bacterium]|nr:hypothetical protein [Phycisphaerae bacterium]
MMTRRFVILHHTMDQREHWDFLLEESDALATWQCPADPTTLSPGQSIPCRKLPDHRMAYLHYEGPVSRDRGCVRRAQHGDYQVLQTDESHRQILLKRNDFNVVMELQQEKDDHWTLRRIE